MSYVLSDIREDMKYNTTCIQDIKTDLAQNKQTMAEHLSWHDGKDENGKKK
jgi:hypothetical protein